jgi:hypothetical protein
MRELINSITDWRPIDPPERIKRLRKANRVVSRFIIGDRIAPIDLYVYLKARFGMPNGIQTILRAPDSDNLFHWQYAVGTDSVLFEPTEANLYMEVVVEGVGDVTDAKIDDFFAALKKDFANYGKEMSEVRKSLEHWELFVNPYKRLHDVLLRTKQELIALNISEIDIPETPQSREGLENLQKQIQELGPKFDDALRLGVTLRMLTPVLGEAFVNLLIFILAKEEIKKDARLYQDAIRREIDVRVKSLHLICDGFEKPVDASSERFKNFHTLMNGRNDFLHGNVDPTKLKFDSVFFDYGTIPIFKKRASFGELALSHKLIHVEPESALASLNTVLAFIDLVLESLDKNIREVMKRFMHTTSPGWRPDVGRAGILFPEVIVHTVLGGSKRRKTSRKKKRNRRNSGE